ncbi:MAG TPA: META domain-containing protein [Methanoregula sp.]|nr:META domain-containing protein [Methanoregula sp.]
MHILPSLAGAMLITSLILAAGCTGQVPPGAQLNGTGWSLTGYVHDGTPAQVLNGTTVTLVFDDARRISGSAGCNHYFASYEVKGTGITIGQAGSTEMYCMTTGVMEQESTYLSLLGQAKTVTVDGDRLTLSDAKGTPVLSFNKILPPVPAPLVGTNWTLASFHSGDSVSSVIAGTTLTAIFSEDGRVSGSAGCNSYFAHYNSMGTSLSINGIGSTKMYCGASGVMQQESTYLSRLGQAATFTIEGNQLSISDAKGITLLSFVG